MPFWIDAHCHLALFPDDSVRDEAVARARRAGVQGFIQGGVSPDDWDHQLELSEKYPGVYPVFGIHPWWVAEHSRIEVEAALDRLPAYLEKGYALGELGIDHAARIPRESFAPQEEIFRRQLELAVKMNVPLVLHLVQGHEVALRLFRKVGVPAAGGIVHSFSGGWEVAKSYLDLGLTLSVGGGILRQGFEKVKAALPKIPADRLTLESDAPNIRVTGDAKFDELAELLHVARGVEALTGRGFETLLNQSSENLRKVLRLKA